MNVRKKFSEKLYNVGQSKLSKKVVIPTVVTTGIMLTCGATTYGLQSTSPTMQNTKVTEFANTIPVSSVAYQVPQSESINKVDLLYHVDKMIDSKDKEDATTDDSTSATASPMPNVIRTSLNNLRMQVETGGKASAASGSESIDIHKKIATSPAPLASTMPNVTTDELVTVTRVDEVFKQYEKVASLEKTVDSLSSKNDELEKELKRYREEERKRKVKEKKIAEAKRKKAQQIKMEENRITSLHLNPSDVREISGANAHTLNVLLSGTYLEGFGEVFYNMERRYGINALFSIGNSILETGWDGDNWLARNKNNIFGFNTDRYFASKGDCIAYWFDLISNHYVGEGLISMYAINTKYCPPNDNWSSDIRAVISRLVSKNNLTLN